MDTPWIAVDAAEYDALSGRKLGRDFLVLQTDEGTWTVHAIMHLDEDGTDGLEQLDDYPSEAAAMQAAEQMLRELQP
jgi:hypothetical protein